MNSLQAERVTVLTFDLLDCKDNDAYQYIGNFLIGTDRWYDYIDLGKANRLYMPTTTYFTTGDPDSAISDFKAALNCFARANGVVDISSLMGVNAIAFCNNEYKEFVKEKRR